MLATLFVPVTIGPANMENIKTEIRLAGSRDNTVIKSVSAPEVAVLRAIHGHDAVKPLAREKNSDVSPARERERLVDKYGAAVIEKLFPGIGGKIPSELLAVGIQLDAPAAPKPAKQDK